MVDATANFECDMDLAGAEGVPQKFELDIELKGNFTFSWSLAFDSIDFKVLCGEHFFLVKELVKRTHLGAIPVIPLDPLRFLDINGTLFDPQLDYINKREIDISLDRHSLDSLLLSFSSIGQPVVEPSVSLLGGIYRSDKSNSFLSVVNVFDIEIWVLILLTLFISPILLAIESWMILSKRSNKGDLTKIRLMRKHLWSVMNAMFMPTYNFKYLNRVTYRTIIGFLLIFKILNSTLFSSQILSVTIEDPYYVIDSIEEFNNRSDIEPLVFVSRSSVNALKNEHRIGDLIIRAQQANHILEYDHENLFQKIDTYINMICIRYSHIFLMNPGDAQIIVGLNKNKYGPITHISRTKYLDTVYGYVYHKDVNPMIVDVFNKILSQSQEGGLVHKWVETGLIIAYGMFADKSFVFDLVQPSDQMELDEIKIVLGPYMAGICLAFLALIWEYFRHLNGNDHAHSTKENSDGLKINVLLSKEYKDIPVIHFPEYRVPAPPVYTLRQRPFMEKKTI